MDLPPRQDVTALFLSCFVFPLHCQAELLSQAQSVLSSFQIRQCNPLVCYSAAHIPDWQELIKYTKHLYFHHSEGGECQYFLKEENEGKHITKSPWARLHPGKEPSGGVWRRISKYLKTQKSSHSNSQCFLVTEVSWLMGSLGNNQPDNMGVLTMRGLLLR